MFKVCSAIGFLVMIGFSGYGVAKAFDIHVPQWLSAAITMIAIFLLGFGEGID